MRPVTRFRLGSRAVVAPAAAALGVLGFVLAVSAGRETSGLVDLALVMIALVAGAGSTRIVAGPRALASPARSSR